jgi:hypothetical protein
MQEQTKVFTTLELVMEELRAVAAAFCPRDQEFLHSCVRSRYITAGVGTTLEILHLTIAERDKHAQHQHFDKNNTAGNS